MAPAISKHSKKDHSDSEEEDDTFEGPWKFMGGLDPQDPRMMRRVMAKLYKVYNSRNIQPTLPKYNIKVLTKEQRARINMMLKEASDDNPLLVSMLTWFGKKHNAAKDSKIVSAALVIRDKVNQFVRSPRMYTEEYKSAVMGWKDFLTVNEVDVGGHIDAHFENMLVVVDRAHTMARALAKRDAEDAGLVVPEVSFATAEDDEDTEPEEEAEPRKRKRKKPHTETQEVGVCGFKQTRSGRDFRSTYMQETLHDDDEELEQILEQSRLEFEQEERVRERQRDGTAKQQESGGLCSKENNLPEDTMDERVITKRSKKKKLATEIKFEVLLKKKKQMIEEAEAMDEAMDGLSFSDYST